MAPSGNNPHPTVLLALASVAVSLGAVPLMWVGDFRLGSLSKGFCMALTVVAMLLAGLGARAMLLVRWRDRTHPSVLMGITSIAVGMTAVPLRGAGTPEPDPLHQGLLVAIMDPLYQGLLVAIMLVAMVLAFSCVATALGRMAPVRVGLYLFSDHPQLPETRLQAFPASLGSDVLDDIADTYEEVWQAIAAAHDAGTCSRKFVRTQVQLLRGLATRVDTAPTDFAIRAEADVFDRKARRAARSMNSASALYIREQCHKRFTVAVTIANHRRGR